MNPIIVMLGLTGRLVGPCLDIAFRISSVQLQTNEGPTGSYPTAPQYGFSSLPLDLEENKLQPGRRIGSVRLGHQLCLA